MLRNVEAMPEVWDFDEDAAAGVDCRCNRLRLDRALSIALGERASPVHQSLLCGRLLATEGNLVSQRLQLR